MSATSGTGEAAHDRGERPRGVRVGHREPHDVGAGLGERAHLGEGPRDVGRLGRRHRLHRDWRPAADGDVPDPERPRHPAGREGRALALAVCAHAAAPPGRPARAAVRLFRAGRARPQSARATLPSSSWSTIAVNASSGWAPESERPLMKNAGVPVTPTSSPAFLCCLDELRLLAGVEAAVELAAVDADVARVRLEVGDARASSRSAKSFSCISQYFPWSPAQCAASAALGACACMGSGKSRYTSRILPGYFASSSFTVGSARTQYGHSKSENSTIVIGARRRPLRRAGRVHRHLGRLVRREQHLDVHLLLQLLVELARSPPGPSGSG